MIPSIVYAPEYNKYIKYHSIHIPFDFTLTLTSTRVYIQIVLTISNCDYI